MNSTAIIPSVKTINETVLEFQKTISNSLESAKIKKLESRLRLEQEYFNIMQEFSNDILFRLNIKDRTLFFHQSRVKIFNFPPVLENFPEVNRAKEMIHPDDVENYIAFSNGLILGKEGNLKFRIRLTDGRYETFHAYTKAFCDEKGKPLEMLGKLENIQKYIDLESKFQSDGLTGALIKTSFEEKVKNQLSLCPDDNSAFFFIDLDNFKGINDGKGHSFGDFVLKTVGKVLRKNIRDSDLCGRVGGDEFALFLSHVPTTDMVLEKGHRILDDLNQEFSDGQFSTTIQASIGIAFYPNHGSTFESLYHKADLALYTSKRQGKNTATLYQPIFEHSAKK